MKIYEDLRVVQSRLTVVQSVVAALLGLLVLAFGNLQVVRARHFQGLADNNRTRSVTLAAPRGALLDRKGRVLVENRPSFNVVLTPEHSRDLDETVSRVARVLHLGEAQIRERLARRAPPFKLVVLRTDASLQDVAAVEARRRELPEVNVEVVPLRSYPLASAAAHTLGRVGEVSDRQLEQPEFSGLEPGALVGQAGLESEYNKNLMGKDGVRRVIVNSRGLEVKEAERTEPEDGPALTLTLDAELQRAAEAAFRGRSGSAVALDPETGEILALTSSPAYDPNRFTTGIEMGLWQKLNTDPEKPLINRVIQGLYAPGSTFKIVAAAAGLEEGLITPYTTVYCPGYYSIYGTVRRCAAKGGHGLVSLRQAIARSCNVYFYQLGVKLEIGRLSAWAKKLGLGSPTGVDLPGELSGLMPSPEWKLRVQKAPWYAGETVSVAIGQGQVMATPLQLARLAAVVANGGRLVRPHLVKSVGGVPTPWPAPEDLGLKPETVRLVLEGMRSVVTEGTGRRAQVPGVEVAGKTGSAQVVASTRLARDPKSHKLLPHGWFVCFAPVDRPRIAMAVLVEHGGSGGEAAAPVAQEILARYFGKSVGDPSMAPAEIVDTEPVVEDRP
ncbi:MAG TPA: penicillin-binding protein 2 [Vicinamibacteria bacterium]